MPQTKSHSKHSPFEIQVSKSSTGVIIFFPNSDTSLAKSKKYEKFHFVKLENIDSNWLNDTLTQYNMTVPPYAPNGHVMVTNEGDLIRAYFNAVIKPTLECARCLTEFNMEIKIENSAFFIPRTLENTPTKSEIELSENDLNTYLYHGIFLNLDEFILDSIETAIPLIALCNPGCLGLCNQCGSMLTTEHSC